MFIKLLLRKVTFLSNYLFFTMSVVLSIVTFSDFLFIVCLSGSSRLSKPAM